MVRNSSNKNLYFTVIFALIVLGGLILVFYTPDASAWTKSLNVYNCSNCSDCTSAIANASSGDIVQLNTSLSGISSNCINFNTQDNVTFDCQNNYIQGDGSTNYYGIYLSSSSNNTVRNCNVSGFSEGIYLSSSSNNILTNITANNNSYDGIYLYLGSNNTLTNITANLNSWEGFYLDSSSGNTFTNIITQENADSDVYFELTSGPYCNQNFTNITGSGGRPIEFYDYSTTIENKDLSELILCNADNSIVNNVTIRGSDTLKNNALFLIGTNNTHISNVNSSANSEGVYLELSSNNNILNITTNSNGYSGVYLSSSSNNTLTNITANSNSDSGVYLSSSSNNTLTNITTNSNSDSGVYLDSSSNNTVTNITTNSNNNGVNIYSSSNNILTNITANLNSVGFNIYSSSNNNLNSITTNSNSQQGFYLQSSSNNNTFTNIISNSNINSFYLDTSSNNTLTNITANSNSYGIYLYSSSNNILTNITANNNSYDGIYLTLSSNINIISNSYIKNNTQYGIYFSSSNNNTFYNNIFNNTVNYYNASAGLTNYFNTTKTLGTNILGGIYVGGNYWENWSAPGTGFSETCTDANSDGICDSSYGVDGENYDYLALSASQPTCNSCSGCSNKIQSASSGDKIYLTQDLSGISGNCIDFNGMDNVTFDCQNNFIQGDTTGYGIYLNESSEQNSNNNVRNCNVTKFNYGVYFKNSDNNTLTNIIANSNTQYGFYLSYSSNNTLTNITANSNSNVGLYLFYSPSNIFTNTTTNSNQFGIESTYSSYSTLTNIITQGNNQYDIYFYISSDSQCNNNFTNIIGSGGRSIEYYNYSTTIQDKELSELILCNADDSVVNNITIRGSDSIKNNGILTFRTDNTNLSNVNSSDNYHGFYFYSSTNNALTNITANSNSQRGFYIRSGSNNNTLINITANSNSQYGLLLSSSSNNTLTSITANSNTQDGIFLGSSSNNTLTSITANSNTQNGIYLYNSNSNIINNSHIKNNTQYGIYFSSSNNNTIYNNIFNNTLNYYNASAGLTNYFNTTKTSGANIIGGSWRGGNYWGYPNGTGFSDTCTDSDSDGICDSSYGVDGENYDYLPLVYCRESWSCTAWSTCSGGTQTRTCTDANSCGTTNDRPALSQTCTTTGGGGGGGIVAGQPTETYSWDIIEPDNPAEMEITNQEIDITKITIDVSEIVTDASIKITKVDVVPQSDIKIGASGDTYQSFQIDTTNLNDTNIEFVTIEFKINKTWVDEQGTIDDINLYRKQDTANQWDELNTTFVNSDSDYYYFSTVSPGFSVFTVVMDLLGCNNNNICESELGENEINCQNDCKSVTNGKNKFIEIIKQFYWWRVMIIILIIIIVMTILITHFKKRRQNKRLKQIMEYKDIK